MENLGLVSTYLYGPFHDVLGCMTSIQSLALNSNGNSATMMVGLKNLYDLETLWLGNITELVRKLP
jgi:hypothetical protein